MPVGRPTDEGLVRGSRHYSGGHGNVGVPMHWHCPACGQENLGRLLEAGCLHCGSGDPAKNRAGVPPVAPPPPAQHTATEYDRRRDEANQREAQAQVQARSRHQVEQATKIYRLLEYVVKPGKDLDAVLRNSLVGRIEFDWGSLTATIVDTLDPVQEDRLRMARMQPGVWLANRDAMQGTPRSVQERSREAGRPVIALSPAEQAAIHRHFEEKRMAPRIEVPDTGPTPTAEHIRWATGLLDLGGPALVYTLALGLQAIAEEVGASMEAEKFLSQADCLSLANALMGVLPTGWLEGKETTDDGPIT